MSDNLISKITLGRERYNDEGFQSENILTEAGLSGPDQLTSTMTYLNEFIRDESPFMWLNGGQKGYMNSYMDGGNSIPIGGDGRYTWPVMGQVKRHSSIISHGYGANDKPGANRQPFTLIMGDRWLKDGWLCTFRDQTIARVFGNPKPAGTNWEYKFHLIGSDPQASMSITNLTKGNLVREGVYAVANQMSIGTETNSQTPMKRTNQISYIRNSDRITGNIANMEVKTFEFSIDGGGSQKYWMPWHYWVWRKKDEINTERFLFKVTEYNRDADGRIYLTDHNAGGRPIPLGASIQQMIEAQGNEATYGRDFSIDFFKKTVADVFYGMTASNAISLTGYAGEMYMDDFGRAMETDIFNKGYVQAMGDNRVLKTDGGYMYNDRNIQQYITPKGNRFTLVHMPFLDDAGVSEQARHPRTNKPISSHSAYYIAQGMVEDGDLNVQLLSQKGRAFQQGIYQGMTPLPDMWSGNGDTTMLQLATERDEASIHTFRSIGVNIRDTRYTFWHHSEIEL